MRIVDISNNADGVRVYNHRKAFTKADLLAYARNVSAAKYADISTMQGKSVLSHEIHGNAKTIAHHSPKKMEHPLRIRQRLPHDSFMLEDYEALNDIIVFANSRYESYNVGQYSELFNRIGCFLNGDMEYDYEVIKDCGYVGGLRTLTELVNYNLGVNANTHQVGKVRKWLENGHQGEHEFVAEVLTTFTPHTWETAQIHGCCQGDWADIVYPSDVYNEHDIETFEALYFGLYMDYEAEYNGDSIWYTFCDFEEEDDIIKWISGDFDTNTVKYYSYW